MTPSFQIQFIAMKYFTFKELCHSNTAYAHNIDNTPKDQKIYDNLEALVDNILDPAREQLGWPIYVNCAYRCPEVNKLVGGVSNSQHIKGQAADIWCKNMTNLWNILRHLDFDQLIHYKNKNFYHVSYNPKGNRHQILYY